MTAVSESTKQIYEDLNKLTIIVLIEYAILTIIVLEIKVSQSTLSQNGAGSCDQEDVTKLVLTILQFRAILRHNYWRIRLMHIAIYCVNKLIGTRELSSMACAVNTADDRDFDPSELGTKE